MNKIEQMFFDAWNGDEYCSYDDDLVPGKIIGPYKVDFYYETKELNIVSRFVIEIDGHESHKTKEQRDYDYKRERYLQKQGCCVIRFMGTEVFLDAQTCI